MLKFFPFLSLLFISACATKNFVGDISSQYDTLSCELDEQLCEITFGDGGDFISYQVEKSGNNQYRVQGDLRMFMQITGAMHPKVSFYILFMNDDRVVFERRVKTSRIGSFDFSIETQDAITKTSVHEVLYHYRS